MLSFSIPQLLIKTFSNRVRLMAAETSMATRIEAVAVQEPSELLNGQLQNGQCVAEEPKHRFVVGL
jgi:hypothetical protein